MGNFNLLNKILLNLQIQSNQLRPSLKASNKNKIVWGNLINPHSRTFSNISIKTYHCDQNRGTKIKCEASHSGLGLALKQELEEEIWAPIAFASQFLNDQEKKYSSIY